MRLTKAGSLQQRRYLPSAFLVTQMIKNPPAMRETQVQPLGREDLLEKEWQVTLVFLLGESHGQKSLAVYSPWGHKESDTTEQLPQHKPSLSFKVTHYVDSFQGPERSQ